MEFCSDSTIVVQCVFLFDNFVYAGQCPCFGVDNVSHKSLKGVVLMSFAYVSLITYSAHWRGL